MHAFSSLYIKRYRAINTRFVSRKGILMFFQGAGSLPNVVDLDIEVLFCKSLTFVFVIVCKLCMYQLLIHFVLTYMACD